MARIQQPFQFNQPQPNSGAVRPPVIIGVAVLVVGCVIVLLVSRPDKGETEATLPSQEQVQTPNAPSPAPVEPKAPVVVQTPPSLPTTPDPVPTTPVPTAPTQPPPDAAAPATAYGRQLVDSLTRLGLDGTPFTPDKAAQWGQAIEKLVQGGKESIPAIREFLDQNKDLDLAAIEGGDALGQPSLRMTLLDALWEIGGPEATAVSVSTLQSASDPREIAALAGYLEGQAPEQYRGMIINAARESLAMASSGQLAGRDVGPLFATISKYGDATTVADLQNATGQWKYYAAIALAEMPNGAGLNTLIQMAQDNQNPSSTTRLVALEMIAQEASTSVDAQNVLLNQARNGNLPDATWLTLASVLEGHQFAIGNAPENMDIPGGLSNLKRFHLSYGNQNYYSVLEPTQWTDPEVNARIGVINELLAMKPSDLAVQALERSRAALTSRLAQ